MCSLKIATFLGEKKIQATLTKQDPGTSWALAKIYVKHPGRGSTPFQSIHKKKKLYAGRVRSINIPKHLR